jgi:hypothetical protein
MQERFCFVRLTSADVKLVTVKFNHVVVMSCHRLQSSQTVFYERFGHSCYIQTPVLCFQFSLISVHGVIFTSSTCLFYDRSDMDRDIWGKKSRNQVWYTSFRSVPLDCGCLSENQTGGFTVLNFRHVLQTFIRRALFDWWNFRVSLPSLKHSRFQDYTCA